MSARIPLKAIGGNNGYIKRREAVETLLSRIDLLAGTDRVIMRMYFDNGISARKIAALLKVSPSTIARRIRTLSRRLLAYKQRSFTASHSELTSEEMEIANDHFIRGMSLRTIAEDRNCSFYRIRETIRKIKLVGRISNNRHNKKQKIDGSAIKSPTQSAGNVNPTHGFISVTA